MIRLYFGLPGAGKTTHLAREAYKNRHRRRYKHVYTNVHLNMDGVIHIDNSYIGKYDLANSLILIDEATLFMDCRDYKQRDKTTKAIIEFMLLHRHYGCDIFFYSQAWDALDKRIRTITDRVYYLQRCRFPFGLWFSKYYRIPYGIIIPDPKKDSSEKLGDIVQGYCKPSLFSRIFLTTRFFRPFYYKYFDSWEAPTLPPIPES